MIECQIVSYESTAFSHCSAIRMEVFVGEQGVPPEEEMDDLDAASIHLLAFLDGAPVGTGRLIPGEKGTAKIGRMAVLKPLRGQGIGSAILNELVSQARGAGVREVSLSGQLHAIPFYGRFGFVAEGEIFLDAGIEHRLMRKMLD
jgi:predicted GNAT family N-acyltransferase